MALDTFGSTNSLEVVGLGSSEMFFTAINGFLCVSKCKTRGF